MIFKETAFRTQIKMTPSEGWSHLLYRTIKTLSARSPLHLAGVAARARYAGGAVVGDLVLTRMPEQRIYAKQIVTLVSAVDLTAIMTAAFVSDRYFCAQEC